MLRRTIRRMRFYRRRNQQDASQTESPPENKSLSKNLRDNIESVHAMLGNSGDVKVHPVSFGPHGHVHGALVYIDGLVNIQTITDTIMTPLTAHRFSENELPRTLETLKNAVLRSCDAKEYSTINDLVSACLSGNTALLIGGLSQGLELNTKGWEKRGVTEPQSESVVRGPREGFTEDFRTNTALLRRRIKSPQLRLEHMRIGRKTQTDVCMAYIDGVSNLKVVDTVRKRLGALDVDSIIDSSYIEQYIEDAPFSVFPTIDYSEKPDVVAGRVLEGRVAIISDGSPFVLTAPMLFIESFQTAEDYYGRTFYASLVRLVRFLAYFITVFAPAIYIALTTFHQELLPTTLLYTILDAREGTPFPAFIETLIMVFAFEILREAGIRLPRPVGQAISIVGALIMGDAAVSAGIVGAPLVITIALTAVASFIVPEQNESGSLLRIAAMLFATFLGGYGIAMVFLFVLMHLAKLESVGVPYFETALPSRDLQDSYIRLPLWKMNKRPRHLAKNDTTRRREQGPPPEQSGSGAS